MTQAAQKLKKDFGQLNANEQAQLLSELETMVYGEEEISSELEATLAGDVPWGPTRLYGKP